MGTPGGFQGLASPSPGADCGAPAWSTLVVHLFALRLHSGWRGIALDIFDIFDIFDRGGPPVLG
jgi:hypothetical protein